MEMDEDEIIREFEKLVKSNNIDPGSEPALLSEFETILERYQQIRPDVQDLLANTANTGAVPTLNDVVENEDNIREYVEGNPQAATEMRSLMDDFITLLSRLDIDVMDQSDLLGQSELNEMFGNELNKFWEEFRAGWSLIEQSGEYRSSS